MAKGKREFGHVGPTDRGGSKLQEKGPAPSDHKQPQGHSMNNGSSDKCGYSRSAHMQEICKQKD